MSKWVHCVPYNFEGETCPKSGEHLFENYHTGVTENWCGKCLDAHLAPKKRTRRIAELKRELAELEVAT